MEEYKPGTTFPGVIGRTADQSEPAWPEPRRAKEGAPNVLFIVLDDTGFGQFGCYGSPIQTPNLDSLAAGGIAYTNMHTTALCSPSRSCMLTGRNHHSNNMACITEGSTGYPGYNGYIPLENGFLSEILQQHGYNTYAIGKWHLTPADQISAAGPYDRWPLGRGFERFYGFLGGETHQYYPELTYDNHSIIPPRTPEEGYTLNEDLANRAIQFIADAKQVAPNKPFFMYFCTGAMHAPHQVPKEWANKYKGKFDDGWRAVCPWPGPSFIEAGKPFGEPISADKLTELDAKDWELYHIEKDWTENENVAAENRPKLIEMIATWYVEAGKYNVLPIDGRGVLRLADERPEIASDRTSYTYYPGTQGVPANAAVKVLNRPHSITADVEIPAGGAEGILLAHGGIDSGYSFYVKGGKLHWVHNYVGRALYNVESNENIPVGRHLLRFEFEVTGKPDFAKGKGSPGRAKLFIDEKLVGKADVPVTTPLALGLTGGVTCGSAHGSPVTPDYEPPFEFTGKIHGVTVDVSGELIEDKEAKTRMVLARQ